MTIRYPRPVSRPSPWQTWALAAVVWGWVVAQLL